MSNMSIYNPFSVLDDLWNIKRVTLNDSSFPPFNIKQVDDNTRVLELAVAGFGREDLNVEVKNHMLIISGEKTEKKEETGEKYLHKGISSKKFVRSVSLWEHWEVVSADYKDGVLSVKMTHNAPEHIEPHKIMIGENMTEIKSLPESKKKTNNKDKKEYKKKVKPVKEVKENKNMKEKKLS
jgi:molecular chaperone IbpA